MEFTTALTNNALDCLTEIEIEIEIDAWNLFNDEEQRMSDHNGIYKLILIRSSLIRTDRTPLESSVLTHLFPFMSLILGN